MAAGRTTGRYLARLPGSPGITRRFVGSVLRYVAGYDHHALYPANLPQSLLHDLFPGIDKTQVCLSHRYEYKSLPYGEALALASIVSYLRPRKILEIGTFTGAGTLIMAQHADPDCKIFTLDMPPEDKTLKLPGVITDPPEADQARIGARFKGTKFEHQITQLYGDSATFDFSPYLRSVDFVFVDGSHSYNYVMNDTQIALKMLTPRGTILWDDCYTDHPGVAQALDRIGAKLPIHRIEETRFAVYTRFTQSRKGTRVE